MHKVFTINIANQVFQTYEEAFEMLSKYLMTVKDMYGEADNAKSKMADIEVSLAKIILEENNNDYSKIIDTALVSKIIEKIGYPESQASNTPPKKLTRDTENKIIAGVCSGLSHYLNVQDPIWIRLLFVAFMISGIGSSLIIYIVLWAILPPAKNNLNQTPLFSDEPKNSLDSNTTIAQTLADRQNESATQLKPHPIVSTFTEIIKVLVKVAAIIFILFFGFILLIILFFLFTVGVSSLSLAPSLPQFIYESSLMANATIASFIALLVTTIIFFVLLMFQIFSSRKVLTKTTSGLLGIIWIVALFIFFLGVTDGIKQFKAEEKVITEDIIDEGLLADTIIISGKSKPTTEEQGNSSLNFTWNEFTINNDNILDATVQLNIAQSPDQNFHIFKEVSSRGRSKKNALKYIEAVDYQYNISGDTIAFNSFILQNLPEPKLRFQRVELTLYIPEGRPFILDDIQHMILKKPRVEDIYLQYDLDGRSWVLEKGILIPIQADTTTTQLNEVTFDI